MSEEEAAIYQPEGVEPETSTAQVVEDFVRALTRPIITLLFTGMFVASVFTGHVDDIPEWMRQIGTVLIVWWFADRSIQKAIAFVGGGGK